MQAQVAQGLVTPDPSQVWTERYFYRRRNVPLLANASRKTLVTCGENCHGIKQNKAQILVLLATNMDGSRNCALLLLGRLKMLHCMRNCSYFPVTYGWNIKAGMTLDLFGKWLTDWDTELANEGRSVYLLIDNCPAYHRDVPLNNIELKFLLPNTASRLQPLDQGIIWTFKAICKRELVRRASDQRGPQDWRFWRNPNAEGHLEKCEAGDHHKALSACQFCCLHRGVRWAWW